jgi:hypothetical protein
MIRRLCCIGLTSVALAAAAVVPGAGCGGPAATASLDEATVHGTVSVKGKPATRGKVIFNPANKNRKQVGSVEAAIAKDGTYTLKTLVGRNLITVMTPETTKDPALQYFNRRFDVAGGDNTCPIDVTPSQ